MMSCVPAAFEILAFFLFAPHILGITGMEAAVMGAVLGAVSPAVVVPRMVQLIDTGYGTKKSIPQLILAGSSCDDIFVIVLFSTFVSMVQGGHASVSDFAAVPVSIILGAALGAVTGCLLSLFFETFYRRHHYIRSSTKLILVLGFAFLMTAVETWLKNTVALSGLLAVVSMACILRQKSPVSVSKGLSEKFGKLWLGAEVILFCSGRRCSGYTLHPGCRTSCCGNDLSFPSVSLPWRCTLHGRNQPESKGTAFLHHSLSSKGHCAGSHRLHSPDSWITLWKNRPFCSGAGNSYYCPTWSHWDGPRLQKAPVPVTEASICRDYCSP